MLRRVPLRGGIRVSVRETIGGDEGRTFAHEARLDVPGHLLAVRREELICDAC